MSCRPTSTRHLHDNVYSTSTPVESQPFKTGTRTWINEAPWIEEILFFHPSGEMYSWEYPGSVQPVDLSISSIGDTLFLKGCLSMRWWSLCSPVLHHGSSSLILSHVRARVPETTWNQQHLCSSVKQPIPNKHVWKWSCISNIWNLGRSGSLVQLLKGIRCKFVFLVVAHTNDKCVVCVCVQYDYF